MTPPAYWLSSLSAACPDPLLCLCLRICLIYVALDTTVWYLPVWPPLCFNKAASGSTLASDQSFVTALEHHGHKISADQNLPSEFAQLTGCFWVQGCGEHSTPQSGRPFWDLLTLCIQNWLNKRQKLPSNTKCQVKLNYKYFCVFLLLFYIQSLTCYQVAQMFRKCPSENLVLNNIQVVGLRFGDPSTWKDQQAVTLILLLVDSSGTLACRNCERTGRVHSVITSL